MTLKKIRVSSLIKAIEKDEIPWHKGGWFLKEYDPERNEYVVGAACVMGVGVINLGISNAFYGRGGTRPEYLGSESSLGLDDAINGIINFNDSVVDGAQTWEEARDKAIELLTPFKNQYFYASERHYVVKGRR